MTTSKARFKWTDDKLNNLVKCLQEFESSYVKFSFLNIDSFQWLQVFEVIIVIKHKLVKVLQISTFCGMQSSFF